MRDDHPQPQFLIASPDKLVLRANGRVAVGLGLDPGGKSDLSEAIRNGATDCALGHIVASQQEATIFLGEEGADESVQVWRGVTSNYDAYIVSRGPGVAPSVTDSFRNALALLPPMERGLDQDSIADHLLFTTVAGTNTLVKAIGRVGFGNHFHWKGGSGGQRVFDRLVPRSNDGGNPVDHVDAALRRVMENQCAGRSCANQLSGGIDSTLVQTYLPPQTPSVRGEIDSPEYRQEAEYSRRAQVQLGSPLHTFTVSEAAFLEDLCALTRRAGLPAHRPQNVVFDRSFQYDVSTFLSGQFADSLFGLPFSPYYERAYNERHWLRLAQSTKLGRLFPEPLSGVLQRRLERLRQVQAPLFDWNGHACLSLLRTNLHRAQVILGTEKVRERVETTASFVAERFWSEESDRHPVFKHLELGHMLSFFCADSLSHWRQLAHSQGKGFLAPFVCRSVVETALAVPRRHRYLARGRAKHILKDLLKRRLPAFDVNARKLGSDMPIARFFTTGPLKTAFERFPMLDNVEPSVATKLREDPDWLTWNLLSLAIWQKEVFDDPALSIAPLTQSIEWALPLGEPDPT
jgi:asparagine synthase (glutamine-hydrolysing)